jgi:hypothetical protein
VKVRPTIAAIVVLTLVAQTPSSARAQAAPSTDQPTASAAATTTVQWVLREPTPIDLRMNGAWRSASVSSAPLGSWFTAKPAPIRLSQGAITAIIIGGVVLVVLAVAGIAVLGKPGKIR